MLGCTTLPFDAVDPPLHEPHLVHLGLPAAYSAEAMAYFKARAVSDRLTDALVLGADTIVVAQNNTFGKPKDRADAARILGQLAGTRHQVVTGLALVDARHTRRAITHDTTHVVMRPMDPDTLERYLDSRAWEGKAGAYGIQEGGDVNVESIEGSFTNVIGLPMELLGRLLVDWGHATRLEYCRPLPTLQSAFVDEVPTP